ncbi:MAG TPA: glycoside hydrolase family 36 protein [Opitutaceae bacterium]|nr:glycoside hydrolase family 36 protein [Opitutaceae bacterium]
MKRFPLALLLVATALPLAAAPADLSLQHWRDALPFSFRYGGRASSALLPAWQRSEQDTPVPGGERHRISFDDPATGLQVVADVRTFTQYHAIEWVLHFRNQGAGDTPVLENIEPLDMSVEPQADCVVYHARGSDQRADDFAPLAEPVIPGYVVRLESAGGMSSSEHTLPYFNLAMGSDGVIGAIGWTGNWAATFNYGEFTKVMQMTAGMKKTHLVLHPNEEIRTPRILLLGWTGGDWQAAQNNWRRLVLDYYSPHQNNRPLAGPLIVGSWGDGVSVADRLASIREIKMLGMPANVYAMDAAWYGKARPGNKYHWYQSRGDWWPKKEAFPDGLAPLRDALRQAGLGFSLWIEPETANPGTQLIDEHPEWFLHVPVPADNSHNVARSAGSALLNLGNPAARAGITALVSRLITDAGVTWYRQDSNNPTEAYWATQDTPDRIGMTEIKYIEGLYTMWDDLLAQHPGLCIDNCASGGRRLDLEMISRSFIVWRSDYGSSDSIAEQMQTQGLAPWVPLNGGQESAVATSPWSHPGELGSTAQVYLARGGYSAGYGTGARLADDAWMPWMAKVFTEYREVQPYFYGDFYPLLPYTLDTRAWTAWQWDLPGQTRGLVVLLRRPNGPFPTMELSLHAIDAKATYDVEIRTGLEPAAVHPMSGEALAHLQVTLPERPSSELIFYSRRP